MKKYKLLAPAGSKETFYAAINAGADAIYLGGKSFNARHSAENFSDEELKTLIIEAHLADVEVYVTINTLLKDSELKRVLTYASYLYTIGADALIIQDFGLMMLLRQYLPHMTLHASTQMTLGDAFGVQLLQYHGIDHYILSRETPIERIRLIKEKTKASLEAFIHGALCCSYSGQCYISSFFGGRSGNRGRCAQTCRLAYDIYLSATDEKINDEPVYPFSLKELRVDEGIFALKEAGVETFKIEGRMRKAEYVDRVVRYYRQMLDGKEYKTMESQVTQVFNRGFTKGLTLGEFGQDLMAWQNPKNMGVRLGEVVRTSTNDAEILLYNDIATGDGVTYGIGSANKGFIVDYIEINHQRVDRAVKGKTVTVKTRQKLSKGDILFKTLDKNLENEIKPHISKSLPYRPRPLNFQMTVRIGLPIKLVAVSGDYSIEVESEGSVEKSQKIKISETEIVEQLSKLGGTVFTLAEAKVSFDEDAFVSKSILNQLRRQAIEGLEAQIVSRETEEPPIVFSKMPPVEKAEKELKISLLFNEMHGFEQAHLTSIDLIYIPYYFVSDKVMERLKTLSAKIILSLRNVSKSGNYNEALEIYKRYPEIFEGVLVNDLDSFAYAKEMKMGNIYVDYELNLMNAFAVKFIMEEGAYQFTFSIESNMSDIQFISDRMMINSECIIYSNLSLMTIRNCPYAFLKGCKDETQCASCDFYDRYYLKDRKGEKIILSRHKGMTTVYNPIPLNMMDRVRDFEKVGCDYVRIDANRDTDIDGVVSTILAEKQQQSDNEGIYTRGYYYKDLQ